MLGEYDYYSSIEWYHMFYRVKKVFVFVSICAMSMSCSAMHNRDGENQEEFAAVISVYDGVKALSKNLACASNCLKSLIEDGMNPSGECVHVVLPESICKINISEIQKIIDLMQALCMHNYYALQEPMSGQEIEKQFNNYHQIVRIFRVCCFLDIPLLTSYIVRHLSLRYRKELSEHDMNTDEWELIEQYRNYSIWWRIIRQGLISVGIKNVPAKNALWQEVKQWIAVHSKALHKIKELNITDGTTTQIPEIITYLKSLDTLDVAKNKISKIPDIFTQCLNLRNLYLDENGIEVVPASLARCPQLEFLSLTYNHIQAIPGEFAQCPQLQSLDLNHNEIKEIPEALMKCTQLQNLWLDHNQIRVVPETLALCIRLSELSLNANYLSSQEIIRGSAIMKFYGGKLFAEQQLLS